MRPRKYQSDLVNKTAKAIGEGLKRILIQLATGGGKTVTFAYFLSRYLQKYKEHSIVVLVHREELQVQTYNTLSKFGIANVKVEMIETFVNRAKRKYQHYEVIIVDECHIGNHFKMFQYYNNSIIIGFSATPISSNKKIPLNTMFETIITGISVQELIDLNKIKRDEGLVPCTLYAPKTSLDKDNIGKIGGEYNIHDQGEELSKPKLVNAVLENYEKLVPGQKGIIFNSTVAHSHLVRDLFIENGYPCKHLDGKTPKDERKEIIKWFAITDGAILCNVGVATTGFDEPTVEFCIINRLTMSLVLWLQMQGRAARPCIEIGKTKFITIDLCGSWSLHGRFQDDRDWIKIFDNPAKPGDGVAPIKFCPECEALLPMPLRKCPDCGYLFPVKISNFGTDKVEIVLIEDVIKEAQDKGYKSDWVLYEIARRISSQAEFYAELVRYHKEQGLKLSNKDKEFWIAYNRKQHFNKPKLQMTIN